MDEPLASEARASSQKKKFASPERSPFSDFLLGKTRKPEAVLMENQGDEYPGTSVSPRAPVQSRWTDFSPEGVRLIASAILVFFALSAAFFWWLASDLERENTRLLSGTRKLQQALDSFENLNKTITEKFNKLQEEKTALENSVSSMKLSQQSVQDDIDRYESEITSIQEEKVYLEEMLINKTKEIERLKRQAGSAAAGPAQAGGVLEINRALDEKDREIRRLTDMNRMLLTRLDKFYKSVNDKIFEINVAKIALEDTVVKARKSLEEEWNAVDLGSISVESQGAAPAAAQAAPKPKPVHQPKSEGRVLATNMEHGFVVVDMGKADRVSPDTVFSVMQKGQPVATLTVLETRETMSACNVKSVQPGVTIAQNDPIVFQAPPSQAVPAAKPIS